MSIIIGIDHGYYAIKTAHCSFPAGLTSYGEHEPYTRQGLLEFGGCFFVCGSGRQPIQRDKTINDNYYLLTLAAIAKEIRQRGLPPECSVRIAAGLPLTSFGEMKIIMHLLYPIVIRFHTSLSTVQKGESTPQLWLKDYADYGITYNEQSGGWYYNNQRIKILLDSEQAVVYTDEENGVCVTISRDGNHQISEIKEISETDAQSLMLKNNPIGEDYTSQE